MRNSRFSFLNLTHIHSLEVTCGERAGGYARALAQTKGHVAMQVSICPRLEIALLVLFALFLSSHNAFPQERNPRLDSLSLKVPSRDLGTPLLSPWISLPWSFKTDQKGMRGFLLQPSPIMGPESLPGFLRLSLAQPMQSPWDSQQKLSLASCWREDLLREQAYSTFRMILGAMEAGGTAYLLYKHIRKYGLK
jgi:hypothetical protein